MTCEKVETQIMKHSKLTLQYEWYKDALKCIREQVSVAYVHTSTCIIMFEN